MSRISNGRDVEQAQADAIPLRDLPDPHWQQLFAQYDLDRDGRLNIRELKAMINSPGFHREELPDSCINRIMNMADTDNNGYLDIHEFVKIIHEPEFKSVFGHLVQRYIHIVVPGRRHHGDVTDGQYEEQYSCCPPSVFMIGISIIEFTLYLIDAHYDHHRGTGPMATVLIYNPYKRYEAWRFLSYMFVHIGSVHLVVNLIVQLLLGIPLEMVHRWWRVLIIYMAGVVAGSLGTSIADPHVLLAGASGGVYALIAAHLATLFLNWAEMEFAVIQLLIYFCIIATDVGTAIYDRYILEADKNIGYVAHLAGAVAGLLVGIGVLRNLEVRSWEKKLWWCAIILYFLLMAIAVLLNIFWADHFPESRPDYK